MLLWHIHGSWTTAFVHGRHEYLVPVTPARDADGRGRAATYSWPTSVREVACDRLRDEQVDVVVLQRPEEVDLAERWLGRRPGRDLPAVYVEHNAPKGGVPDTVHPVARRGDIPLVHVTNFNRLFWENGRAPTVVVEHGVVDPGYRFTGEWPRAGVVVNEPLRRWRTTGTDLLPALTRAAPLDVYGMRVTDLPRRLGVDPALMWVHEDLPQARMHAELARRRVYVHPIRWTSLGLSLIEAMHLGLPVVALATTEAVEALPPEAGVATTRVDRLVDAIKSFVSDPIWARQAGKAARAAALERYSLPRFQRDWDCVLQEVCR
ncbi:MAG: glycosyltransferase [Streptosporangiales bacterium]|nr:glycosyltransferase [Streptosporangiales bacterium]